MSSRVERLRSRIRKVAFEALYGPFAWAYDWVSGTFFLGQWRRWQRAAIPHCNGPDVLEVGMGTGDLQADLDRAGFRAWGVDLSPQMLSQAARKAGRLGHQLNACRARAQALPFPDSCFDSVISTFPTEYIAEPETLHEIRRVLRPEGRLIIVPGGWLQERGARGRAMEGVANLVYGSKGRDKPPGNARDLQSRSEWSPWLRLVREKMDRAGFEVSARVMSNERGGCLIVIADKRG